MWPRYKKPLIESWDEVDDVLSERCDLGTAVRLSSVEGESVTACSKARGSGPDSVGDRTRNLLAGLKGTESAAERTRKR